MKNTKKILAFAASTLVAFGLAGGVAFADTGADASVKTAIQQASSGSCDTACMNIIKAYGDKLTTDRVTSLTKLETRIEANKVLSADQKAALTAKADSSISAMNALKAKIDADTVLATLVADVQSITKDYRIYVVVHPQIRIGVKDDVTIAKHNSYVTLGADLQAKINGAVWVSQTDKAAAQAALDDMNAKIADAQAQANAANAEVLNLHPDHGDKAVRASNKAAVADAKAKIKAAGIDMKAAKADVKTVRNLLKRL